MKEAKKTPRPGAKVSAAAPRNGAAKTGKFVQAVDTAFGVWWEIKPTAGGEVFRARPASVTVV